MSFMSGVLFHNGKQLGRLPDIVKQLKIIHSCHFPTNHPEISSTSRFIFYVVPTALGSLFSLFFLMLSNIRFCMHGQYLDLFFIYSGNVLIKCNEKTQYTLKL